VTEQNKAKTWSANRRKFQAWLALPTDIRQPRTQGEFANAIGVHETTLSKWKKLEGWQQEVDKLALTLIRDDLSDILRALVKEAKQGSPQHIKMYLEMLGLYAERKDINLGDRLTIDLKWPEEMAEDEK